MQLLHVGRSSPHYKISLEHTQRRVPYLDTSSLACVASISRLAMASSEILSLVAPILDVSWELSYPSETGAIMHGVRYSGWNDQLTTLGKLGRRRTNIAVNEDLLT
jgi:hypothetical protein